MNKKMKFIRAAKATAMLSTLPVAAIVAATVSSAAAQADSQDQPKTHTLFMGADISVERNKSLYSVQDVSGNSWVIKVDGSPVTVSPKDGPMSIKIQPSLKLTERSASVVHLDAVPSYSPKNDPGRNFANETAAAENLYIGYQMNLTNATISSGTITNTLNNYVANPNTPGQNAQVAQELSDAKQAMTAASNGAGSTLDIAPGARDKKGFDAMDVTFEISAARPLNAPYVVLITRFHDRNDPPATIKNLVYAQALNPVGSEHKVIHLQEAGFPSGFELRSFQLHLYDNGEEIATDVSSKRVSLTRDEAFEYVKMEYVGAHKDATLPPVPAMGKLPPDLPSRIAGGQFNQTYYVKVSKEGLPNDAFLDIACSQKVTDPYLESVVREIRFKPALQNGKPVDGVAPLRISQLLM
jgi:hypothetical protein